MFHGNAEFWGNRSEPVFTITRESIIVATVQECKALHPVVDKNTGKHTQAKPVVIEKCLKTFAGFTVAD